jgi:hypothetical protein
LKKKLQGLITNKDRNNLLKYCISSHLVSQEMCPKCHDMQGFLFPFNVMRLSGDSLSQKRHHPHSSLREKEYKFVPTWFYRREMETLFSLAHLTYSTKK